MFGIAAVVAFSVALILEVVDKGSGAAKLVLEFELAGFICLAVHLVFPTYPWRHG